MAASVAEYYHVLGVTVHSSVDEIKRAYRKKAQELHPDKNTASNAHEQFVLLNEAYQYLLSLKTGKVHTTQREEYYQNWQQQRGDEAREKAREYARMRWEEYTNSEDYKAGLSLDVIVTHLMVLFLWAVLIVVPIAATFTYGLEGFIGSAIPISLVGYFLLFRVKEENHINFKLFVQSVKYIRGTRGFIIAILSVFNVFILLKIGLQTFIPLMLLPLLVLAPAIVLNIVLWAIKFNKSKRLSYSYCLWPFAVSLFFFTNFIFSSNAVEEKYGYYMTTQNVRGGSRGTNYVVLEGNAYAEYPGIRYFFSFEEVKTHNTVTYTFADGLYGIRVMRTYEFTLE